MAEMELIE
jgi:hypothetical protein